MCVQINIYKVESLKRLSELESAPVRDSGKTM